MKIILVRHGETNWNTINKVQGGLNDIPLNEKGILQSKRTGLKLKDETIDLIFSSPMKRAIETANEINVYQNLTVEPSQNLLERIYGKYEGTSYHELNDKMYNTYLEDNYEELDIERLEVFEKRLREFVDELKNKHSKKTILIVSHSSVSKMLISILLNVHLRDTRINVIKKNASISTIVFDENNNILSKTLGFDEHLNDI